MSQTTRILIASLIRLAKGMIKAIEAWLESSTQNG